MTFLGAILEHFGLHFGTQNDQKRHQNMSMKKVQKKKSSKKNFLDMGTGSAICLETLARTRLSMTSLSFRARACVSDKGVIGDSKQGAH